MTRYRRWLLPVALFVALTAHVGSPNVVYDGEAGPYGVRVVVRPPMVVPGRAEVIVQLAAGTAHVTIRPVFWRAGVAGAPTGDDAPRVAGSANVYSGQIWLMSRGSYSVYVTVSGARGTGTAIVPVTSFATGRLGLSTGLAAILVALGAVLFVGLITIVRAATGEALLEPGERMTDATRRRARTAMLVATPVLGLLVFGGARWWGSVDGDYERTMYRPPAVDAKVERVDGGGYALDLRVHDTAAFHAIFAPVIPDHGKMMHLFVVSEGNHYFFGHFHPTEMDSLHFRGVLTGMPPGEYNLFGDIVLANGLSQTVTASFDWPLDTATVSSKDPDDATWHSDSSGVGDAAHPVMIGDGLSIIWTGGNKPIVANEAVDLRFEVRDGSGTVARLAPYLGMAAHAVVLKSDESVFIHLHPMGTVSTSAQQTFAARDRGDTTASGRPMLADTTSMGMPMSMDGRLDFPYEFPKAGRYRVWVQVRPSIGARVLTGAFDLDVR
jgi:hypothetical protein